MADDVDRRHAHDADALDILEDLAGLAQARSDAARQIDLPEVARDDHARAEAQARQEHLHLLVRRVLRLIEDDEGVLERAAAHVGERRDLDDALGHELLVAVLAEDVLQGIVERAQVRIDLVLQVARQEAETLPRLDGRARQDDAAHFFVAQGSDSHDDGQVRLARARRADAERDGIMANRVEVAALSERLRAHVAAPRRHEDRVAEQRVQSLALAAAHEADAVADLVHRDRRSLAVEILELLDERCRHLDLSGLAEDLELLAAADELAVKILAQHLQELVPVPEQRIRFFVVFKDNLSFQCLLQRNTSPASFYYIEIELPT